MLDAYLIVAIQNPAEQYLNLSNLVFSRFVCTIFAVVLIVLVKILFSSEAMKPKYSIVPALRGIIEDFRGLHLFQNMDFALGKQNSEVLWDRLFAVRKKIYDLRQIVSQAENEFDFIKTNQTRYSILTSCFNTVCNKTENMVFLANHSKNKTKEIDLSFLEREYLQSKEFLKEYIRIMPEIEKNSAVYLYLRSFHNSLQQLNRIEKIVKEIEES
ncbi:MAG TPA: hypothetical protein DD381_05400 [Lentisphaeria bacterium]|nr:MAG: hypothetical protein A2X47_10810 [Lentisphaerae bacterium GWF2_38_69]HBM15766.1 hypothetical protein [Lentisphaeria bacterium]